VKEKPGEVVQLDSAIKRIGFLSGKKEKRKKKKGAF
jgi:hypothetical protein